MPQIFRRRANTLARTGVAALILLVGGLSLIAAGLMRSPYVTTVGMPRTQPVPYSHKLHVGQLGLDCRYCHTSVETSSFAGLPSTETCMNCHAQVGLNNPLLEPVRKSYQESRSIEWTRVNDLPDYVYFDHSIHIHKGVGCITCHGQVDQLSVMVPAGRGRWTRAWTATGIPLPTFVRGTRSSPCMHRRLQIHAQPVNSCSRRTISTHPRN